MNLKPPSLSLLPAFEATARLSSFKSAAEELCVTPSAVSQQIKLLESRLGTKLFARTTRKVALTKSGDRFYKVVHNILSNYQNEFEDFRCELLEPNIRLSTSPFIAHDLLIPSMHLFDKLETGINLRIEETQNFVDLSQDKNSVALRLGGGNWQNLDSRLLAPLRVNIIAKKDLVSEGKLINLDELKNYSLIHSRTNENDWDTFAEILGVDLSNNENIYLDNYLSAIALTEQGLGIMIALMPITNHRLKQGKLETLLQESVELPDRGFYFVRNKDSVLMEGSDRLFEWVLDIFEGL
jgi:LysR family glycine cleavage system transcriptional activator